MKFAVIGSQTKKSLSPKLNNWIYKCIKEKHSYGFIQINNYQLDNVIGDLRKNDMNFMKIWEGAMAKKTKDFILKTNFLDLKVNNPK